MRTTLLKSKRFKYILTLLIGCLGLILISLFYPVMNETIYNGFNVLLPREQFITYEAFILFASQLSVYAILKDNRSTWYPLLAYPKSMRKTLIRKAFIALIATIPMLLMTTIVHCIIISSKDVSYLWMLYAMHFTAFLLENYAVADGYLNNQIINLIHVLSIPFFYSVIINLQDWLPILVNLSLPILITLLLIMVIIFIRININARRIIFHEIFLKEYFKNHADGRNILITAKAKKIKNHLNLYQHFDPHKKGYWCLIAYIDVMLKKRWLLIGLILILLILKLYVFVLLALFLLMLYLLNDYLQLKKIIRRTLIRQGHH